MLERLSSTRRLVGQLAASAQVAKAARGGAWTMSSYGIQMILRFISRILLAKLLINAAPLR